MRNTLLAAILLSAVPLTTGAAQRSDEVKHRNECRLAAQVVTTGQPAPHTGWAASKIGSCGADAGALVAAAVREHRSTRDVATLSRLADVAVVLRDGQVFQAALEVAGDAGASSEARVFASRTLILGLQPHLHLTYTELADGNCYGTIRGPHAEQARSGSPMPAGFATSARAMGVRVFGDSAAPAPVRRAARCVSVHDAAPFREPTPEPTFDVIRAQDLNIAYVCGNTFQVRNPYEVEMTVRYRVERSGENGSATVPAGGERMVTTRQTGGVRLLDEDGVQIAVAMNEGRSCTS